MLQTVDSIFWVFIVCIIGCSIAGIYASLKPKSNNNCSKSRTFNNWNFNIWNNMDWFNNKFIKEENISKN